MMATPPAKSKPLPPGRRALSVPQRKGMAFLMVAMPGVLCAGLGAFIGFVIGAQAVSLWVAATFCGMVGILIGVRTLIRVLSYDPRHPA